MKLQASYFSISRPLLVENLRRFWAIPVLSFLVYFLSGVFPLLMSYSNLDRMGNYIEMSLNNQQPFYMFAHLMFPVITAVIIFKYLQSISSVSVMHAMPFTRAKLYQSGFLSGLILILLPILVNGLILLAISKPVYNNYGSEFAVNAVNLFARGDILNWIWVSVIIVAVIYAVSVFAGILTGNSLMHFAMAIWFNFLIPALYAVFIAYFSHFLYGFDTGGSWVDFGMSISPFTNALQNAGEFGVGVTLYYIATFLLLYVVTLFLYGKRKLERATDSLAFGFMEPIISYLIAFLGMTLLGFYFDVLGESEFYMYAGLAAGTVIFFIIGRMIVKKTPRIYNKRSLQSLGIYSLIAVLFLISLNIDITGFERRVPDPGKVTAATMTDGFQYRYYYRDQPLPNFKDPENIKAITAFHQSLIDHKQRFEDPDPALYSTSVSLGYELGSPFPMNRRYNIDYLFYRESKDLKKLFESAEYKEINSIKNLKYEKLNSIMLDNGTPWGETIEIKETKKIKEFMECLDKDFREQSFESMTSLKRGFANANINFSYKEENSYPPNQMMENSISYNITESHKYTIQWLKENGYADQLTSTADQIQYIDFYHQVYDDSFPATPMIEKEYATSPFSEQDENSLRITDPQLIQDILDTYETRNINYDDYYYGIIVYKNKFMDFAESDMEAKEMYDKFDTEYPTNQIYFNEGNIPEFLTDYFK